MSVRFGFLRAVLACCLLVACGEPASDETDGLEGEAAEHEGHELQSVEQSVVSCIGAGGFSTSTPCCSGLVKDANNRCQSPTCKKAGSAPDTKNTCCFGLVLINGVCRTPTLTSTCTVLDGVPTASKPCCKGLVKDSKTGKCKASVSQCSGDKLSSCCYGSSVNTCSTCYCPAPYYKL